MLEVLLFRTNMDERSQFYGITYSKIINKFLMGFNRYYGVFSLYVIIIFVISSIIKIKYFSGKNNKKTKEILEKSSLPLLIFISFFSYIFIFTNYYWIHDYMIGFLIPGYFLMIGVLSDYLFDFIGFFLEKIKMDKRFLKISIYLVLILIFTTLSIKTSFNVIKDIYRGTNTIVPIVEFLSKNNGNIIVTYTEDPGYCQVHFYYANRVVDYVQNYDELNKAIENWNPKNFEYIITKGTQKISDDFESYLNSNYNSISLKENDQSNYTVYMINSPKN